eukprot:4003078-Pleurochrysis_carterae.AAC.1
MTRVARDRHSGLLTCRSGGIRSRNPKPANVTITDFARLRKRDAQMKTEGRHAASAIHWLKGQQA